MAGSDIVRKLVSALEQRAQEHGIDIVDVEVAGSKTRPRICVRIDVLEGEGIDMDRVAQETSWVSEVVEAVDPFVGSYDLEVSSPGIDRPLRRPSDFNRFAGERAEVRTSSEIDGKRTFVGSVVEADERAVTLDCDGTRLEIAFDDMKSARLKPDFDQILAKAKQASKLDSDD